MGSNNTQKPATLKEKDLREREVSITQMNRTGSIDLALFFEIDMLAQDRVIFLNLNPLGGVALVLDRMIHVCALGTSQFNMNALVAFFLGHWITSSKAV
jgi:hypothetical protein